MLRKKNRIFDQRKNMFSKGVKKYVFFEETENEIPRQTIRVKCVNPIMDFTDSLLVCISFSLLAFLPFKLIFFVCLFIKEFFLKMSELDVNIYL